MTTRIIRITDCAECPHAQRVHKCRLSAIAFQYCQAVLSSPGKPRGNEPICPPTGTPAWCPLERASDTPSDTAAILLRTIAAEAERKGSWHVPPDLQARLRAWVAEWDGGAR